MEEIIIEGNINFNIYCCCGWSGEKDLLRSCKETDRFHPFNKYKNFENDLDFYRRSYKPLFERCPACDKVLFRDGVVVLAITEEKYLELGVVEKRNISIIKAQRKTLTTNFNWS